MFIPILHNVLSGSSHIIYGVHWGSRLSLTPPGKKKNTVSVGLHSEHTPWKRTRHVSLHYCHWAPRCSIAWPLISFFLVAVATWGHR